MFSKLVCISKGKKNELNFWIAIRYYKNSMDWLRGRYTCDDMCEETLFTFIVDRHLRPTTVVSIN